MSGWSFSLIAFALLLARPVEVVACTTVRWPVPSPLSTAQELTIDAEWIVRATAVEDCTPYWAALDPVNVLSITYAAYSAVIRGLKSRKIGTPRALPEDLAIFGRTAGPVDQKPYREPGSPLPISRDLQTDFSNSIALQDPVLPRFEGFPYRIVAVPRLEEYRSSNDRALLTFSQVGVDRAGTNAIVYFSYQCSRDCGVGGDVVLENRAGEWRIAQVIDAWRVPAERK